MRNIKLVLEYDGSDFYGFQRQPHHPSIQSELEKALSRLFDREVKISAASGRTDTGVHALGQVVNFKINHSMSIQKIQRALNALLPKAVAVRSIAEVSVDFHARFSVKKKCYEYRIWNGRERSPLFSRQSWHVREPLDIRKMKAAAKCLAGRHDFKSFCTNNGLPEKAGKKGTVRTLHRLRMSKEKNVITITFEGDGFLYRMVRNLTGVLVEAGKGKLGPKEVKSILSAKDRRRSVMAAPAEGLFLKSVTY